MIAHEKEMWFVHLGYEPALPLKIERIDGFGATVVGGKTGSHRTGHGETYWDKFVKIIKLGFIPVDVAKDTRQISEDWTPPVESKLDKEIEGGLYRLK